jgi:hypothetical protein
VSTRMMKRTIWLLAAIVLVGMTVATPSLRADSVLVGAPTIGSYETWDSQTLPPEPNNFVFAVEFSLSTAQMVTTIDVLLGGDEGAAFTISLVDNLPFGMADVYTDANLTIFGQNTLLLYSLPVNEVLGPGTFFLAVTSPAGDQQNIGWPVSNGTFNTTDGTVANGMWGIVAFAASSPWNFESGFDASPGVFYVNGPDTGSGSGSGTGTTAPEPGSLAMLGLGLLSLGAITKRQRQHSKPGSNLA